MNKGHLTAGVITAAGRSARMKGIKKNLAPVDGVPVLKIVADTFAACGVFDYLVITYPPGEDTNFRALLVDSNVNILFVSGGETRQESVYNALVALIDRCVEYVLIHDAARPWVTDELIMAVLQGAKEFGACIPVVPHTNASKRVDVEGKVVNHYDRNSVVGAQTPQGFRFAEILLAHQEARINGKIYPDDAEAYHHAVGSVRAIPGDPANRKITFRHDL